MLRIQVIICLNQDFQDFQDFQDDFNLIAFTFCHANVGEIGLNQDFQD